VLKNILSGKKTGGNGYPPVLVLSQKYRYFFDFFAARLATLGAASFSTLGAKANWC